MRRAKGGKVSGILKAVKPLDAGLRAQMSKIFDESGAKKAREFIDRGRANGTIDENNYSALVEAYEEML